MNEIACGGPPHFKSYLEREQFSESSVKSYLFQSKKFIEWMEKEGYVLVHFDYKKAICYVDYLQKKHTNIKTMNHSITAVRHYFDYLIEMENCSENPFTEIRVKGDKTKRMLQDLLSSDELEDLYYSYPPSERAGETETDMRTRTILADKRNKVIIGLMVYQGLSTTDMKKLRPEHIQPKKGKVYVPSGKIGGRRELPLMPWQVMELMEYLNEIWPELVKRKGTTNEELFPVSNGRLTDTVSHIIKKLRKINRKVKNGYQIRASVIVNWLSKYNLRKVQIMAGHRKISTTERYVQEDLKKLHEMVENFHPLS